MASFIRRLFGGSPKKAAPPPAPAPAPVAPAPAPVVAATGGEGQQQQAATTAQEATKVAGRTYKPKKRQKTVYTNPLGLSVAERSKLNLKQLTGR